MKDRINTSKYVAAHGKLPRGRGCWLFEVELNGQTLIWSTGQSSHYGAASAWIRQQASKYGVTKITLCP